MNFKYKSNLYVYLIISAVIYFLYGSAKELLYTDGVPPGWLKAIYFGAAFFVLIFAYYKIARKSDKYIKENHPNLYERYYNILTTDKNNNKIKDIKRPIYIGLQTAFNTDYMGDANVKKIRQEAKLYMAALVIIIILTVTHL